MDYERKEIWKPIVGFEGFYEVSTFGQVRSVDRTVYFKNGKGSRRYKGQILKQKYHNGYALVNLNKNKEMTTVAVHVLVAKAFLPNERNCKIVNHKSGIKSENFVWNLEWCTTAENNEHANKNGLRKNNMDGIKRNNEENKVNVSCYKGAALIVTTDCSRSMARYLIDNKLVEKTTLETLARAVRKHSKNGTLYHGLLFVRHNGPKHDYKETGSIAIISNGVVLCTQNCSKDCAQWLLKKELVSNVSEKTLARSIRKAITENKPYHKFIFKKQ